MYLRDLSYDEKQAYTKLALVLISADNEITQRELNVLELQTKEMGDFELPTFSELDDINAMELLKDTDASTFRKIYFELLLIACSDEFDDIEKDLFEKLRKIAKIDEKEKSRFEACAKAISDTYYVLDRLISK